MPRLRERGRALKRALRIGSPEEKREMEAGRTRKKIAGYLETEKIPEYQIALVKDLMKEGLKLEEAARVLQKARERASDWLSADVARDKKKYMGRTNEQIDEDKKRIIMNEVPKISVEQTYMAPAEKKRFKLWKRKS
jgi:hypothetical protein